MLFNQTWEGEDYWRTYTKECCPGLEELVDIRNPELMRTNRKHKKKEIQLIYWRMKARELDPNQGNQLGQVPRVIVERSDWTKYRNAIKLMVMNYYTMRYGSNCEACKKKAEEVL
jgi:hypothetical protein